MSKGFIIAIDGPVASGKGTVAHTLSEKLSGFDLYTGAMYRSLALFCLENTIDYADVESVKNVLSHLEIDLTETGVILNGRDVTERIKDEDAASGSALVSPYPFVRRAMVKRQQEIGERERGKGKIVIAEGRDTGTVVFPNADLRLYLTASGKIRARRRYEQYQQQGDTRSLDDVFKEIKERDERDTTRETDPLPTEPERLGYTILDNSDLNEEQTIGAIVSMLKERNLLHD
jgi:CMP/dCMP kinase